MIFVIFASIVHWMFGNTPILTIAKLHNIYCRKYKIIYTNQVNQVLSGYFFSVFTMRIGNGDIKIFLNSDHTFFAEFCAVIWHSLIEKVGSWYPP